GGETLGPPAFGLGLSLAARVESRPSSPVSRRIGEGPKRGFGGARFRPAAFAFAALREVVDSTINFCIHLSRPPPATNHSARQASNAGWVGGPPNLRKSFGVGTRPRPKWCCHRRLTKTRGVSGLSGAASHSASTRRLPLLWASFAGAGILGSAKPSTVGKPG